MPTSKLTMGYPSRLISIASKPSQKDGCGAASDSAKTVLSIPTTTPLLAAHDYDISSSTVAARSTPSLVAIHNHSSVFMTACYSTADVGNTAIALESLAGKWPHPAYFCL